MTSFDSTSQRRQPVGIGTNMNNETTSWRSAVGPTCSAPSAARFLGRLVGEVEHLVGLDMLLGFEQPHTSDIVLPLDQFKDGASVDGIAWILRELPRDLVDRRTVAEWLNAPRSELDGDRIWDRLGHGGVASPPEEIRVLVKDYRNDLESSGGVTTPAREVSEVLSVPLTATELARRLDDQDRVAGLVVADPVGTDTTRFTMMLGSKLVGGEDLEDIAYEPVEVRDGRIVWWVSGKLVRSLH